MRQSANVKLKLFIIICLQLNQRVS